MERGTWWKRYRREDSTKEYKGQKRKNVQDDNLIFYCFMFVAGKSLYDVPKQGNSSGGKQTWPFLIWIHPHQGLSIIGNG